MSKRLTIDEINALTDEEKVQRYWEHGDERITVELMVNTGLLNRVLDRTEMDLAGGLNGSVDVTISMLLQYGHEHLLESMGLPDPFWRKRENEGAG